MRLLLAISSIFVASVSFGQNVGIGNPAPAEKLDVNGNIKTDTIKANVLQVAPNAAAGKVLASDAAGNAGWQNTTALPGTIAFIGNIYGYAGTSVPLTTNYEFLGAPTATPTISLNGNQTLIMHMVVGLGKTAAGSNLFVLDPGYQLQPAGSIVNMSGINWVNIQSIFTAATTLNTYSISGSVKLPAGIYKIGLLLKCGIINYFNNNDWINGTYEIVNQ